MVRERGGNQWFPAVHLEGIVRFCTAGSRRYARVAMVSLPRGSLFFSFSPNPAFARRGQ